jgi:hypothetical protein
MTKTNKSAGFLRRIRPRSFISPLDSGKEYTGPKVGDVVNHKVMLGKFVLQDSVSYQDLDPGSSNRYQFWARGEDGTRYKFFKSEIREIDAKK